MYKTKVSISLLVVMCFAICLAGCGKSSGGGEVLAQVGDATITVKDFNSRIENLPEQYRSVAEKRKEEFLDEIVKDTLLYQAALQKGVDKNEDVQELIEEARKKIIITRFLKDEINDKVIVTDEEVQLFYEQNRDKYVTPEIMRVSHILVPTKQEAEKIAADIAQGSKFEDIARAKSVDPTAQRGGDVGYFPKGQLMPEFEAACEDLEIGEVSGVVKTKLGYHVIMLTDRRTPEPMPFDKVKDDAKKRLHNIKRQDLFNKKLEDLRKNTKIEVKDEVLAGLGQDTTESPAEGDEEGGKI